MRRLAGWLLSVSSYEPVLNNPFSGPSVDREERGPYPWYLADLLSF